MSPSSGQPRVEPPDELVCCCELKSAAESRAVPSVADGNMGFAVFAVAGTYRAGSWLSDPQAAGRRNALVTATSMIFLIFGSLLLGMLVILRDAAGYVILAPPFGVGEW